ncbi:unnamed protein product [Cuscuta europaea]|uniref:Transposase (putative) gypsy type domain-containing protein n=1 Tax=Cuscuta europaea TaxID=41803 RepID=A0A9P1E688_CUSEU|nr:unnamed protein product [Cuscuta europaea]
MGLRFPLHPFLREYLRFVGLVPCQLTPNSHSYVAGFLNLCRDRGVTPSLDLFFQSFNLCRGGHANAEGFANLQQVARWKLFTEAPSSNKGWKERWCYVRVAENPFPAELRDRFRRHPKVGSAALEKDGLVIAKIPEGRTKQVSIKDHTADKGFYALGFRRYRFIGESDEKYPIFAEAFGGTRGVPVKMMNVRGLADLKKKKPSKCPRGTDAGVPKPAGDFFKKPEGPSVGPSADAAAAAKRKGSGRDPEGKKPKTGDAGKKVPPVIIVDEGPVSGANEDMQVAKVPPGVQGPSSEVLMVSLPAGTAVMNGTADPRALLRGITLEIDRVALGADEDEALEDRILRSSLTTCIALGEQARRLDEWRLRKAKQEAKMRELIRQNADAVRQMAMLEESLRQMTLRAEAADRGRAEAERSAAEALERAVKEAEAAKVEAVERARGDAISGFLAGGVAVRGAQAMAVLGRRVLGRRVV